jgi:mannose-6-phosphate isomerase-like protein (cupin superfamily)
VWYPEPQYTGENGETNTQFRPAAKPPEVGLGPGSVLSYLATGGGTNREFGLYEVQLAPNAGTTTHFHRAVSEAFYIVLGTLSIFDGADWLNAGPGDFLYVPIGSLHGFRNQSNEAVALLNLFVPGADREGYFEGLAGLALLSDAERLAFFHAHDSYFVDAGGGPSVSSQS